MASANATNALSSSCAVKNPTNVGGHTCFRCQLRRSTNKTNKQTRKARVRREWVPMRLGHPHTYTPFWQRNKNTGSYAHANHPTTKACALVGRRPNAHISDHTAVVGGINSPPHALTHRCRLALARTYTVRTCKAITRDGVLFTKEKQPHPQHSPARRFGHHLV